MIGGNSRRKVVVGEGMSEWEAEEKGVAAASTYHSKE